MQALALFMIIAVTTFEFFSTGDRWGRWAIFPGWFSYFPEILSVLAAAVVVLVGVRTRFKHLRASYLIVFAALGTVIVAGVLVNDVSSGPIFAGIRTYLRVLPWFLLPMVVSATDGQLTRQLQVLAFVGVLQVPLSWQQMSMSMQLGKHTGDWTIGTLMLSPTLTIFMVCCIAVLTAFFARRRLSGWKFVALFVAFFVPALINETKVTIVLLPAAILVALLVAAEPVRRLRYLAMGTALLVLAGAVYVPVYDKIMEDREYTVPLTEFFADKERLGRYMSTTDDIGTRSGSVGRLDSIMVPLRRLSQDPAKLFFGLGIGNVSDSALGRHFVGEHARLYGPFMNTMFGRVVLELGIFGLLCVLALMWLVFRDALIVATKSKSYAGALAAGWAAVTVIMTICIPYTDLVVATPLAFLFWYFSGVVAARSVTLVTCKTQS